MSSSFWWWLDKTKRNEKSHMTSLVKEKKYKQRNGYRGEHQKKIKNQKTLEQIDIWLSLLSSPSTTLLHRFSTNKFFYNSFFFFFLSLSLFFHSDYYWLSMSLKHILHTHTFVNEFATSLSLSLSLSLYP